MNWGMLRALCGLSWRSEEHTSELQSPGDLVCRLLLEKNKVETAFARWIAKEVPLFGLVALHSLSPLATPVASCAASRARRPYVLGPLVFFFNDTATPEISPLPPNAALPI